MAILSAELARGSRGVRCSDRKREVTGQSELVDSTDQRNTRPSTPLGVSDGKDRRPGLLMEAVTGLGTIADRRVNLRYRSGCWLSSRLHLLDSPAVRWDLPAVPGCWGADPLLARHWSRIATVVERTTRYTVLVHVTSRGTAPPDSTQ